MNADGWEILKEEIDGCRKCRLCEQRKHAVPGEGNRNTKVVLVGEGPGAEEDASGRPFVGRAGKLLEEMLEAIDLVREDVYICNVIKCRPPANRTPVESEIEACRPYLNRQLAMIRPQIVVCLGTTACRVIIGPQAKVTACRGDWITRPEWEILATYHPAALLRDDGLLMEAWRDMKRLESKMKSLAPD